MRPMFLAAFFFPCTAHAFLGFGGPKTYEDCVLEKMSGVTSDVAARAVMRACNMKFRTTKDEEVTVPKPGARQQVRLTYAPILKDIEVQPISQSRIRVFNRTGFPIAELRLGVVRPGSKCDLNDERLEAYLSVTKCSGAMPAGLSKQLYCELPPEILRLPYCLIEATTAEMDEGDFFRQARRYNPTLPPPDNPK